MQEILILMTEQMRAMSEVGSLEVLQAQQHAGQQLSMHRKEEHGAYWDSDAGIKNYMELQDKLTRARARFEKNQTRLTRLVEQLQVAA